MIRILFLVAVLTTGAANAADSEPILIVHEMDPWRMVFGSDSAAFAIYDDGTIVYQRVAKEETISFASRMVAEPINEANELLGFSMEEVESDYELSSATDQITTTIWTPKKTIQIYGNWRKPFTIGADDDADLKAIDARERKMWETLPAGLRTFLTRVEKEREKEGEAWLPESIEVMLWPYEYAPDESIIWPAEWPDFESETTRKRGEDSYSIYLPAKTYPDLKKLLSTQKEKGAVLLNGKKMAASYRFPFPHEEKWMR